MRVEPVRDRAVDDVLASDIAAIRLPEQGGSAGRGRGIKRDAQHLTQPVAAVAGDVLNKQTVAKVGAGIARIIQEYVSHECDRTGAGAVGDITDGALPVDRAAGGVDLIQVRSKQR